MISTVQSCVHSIPPYVLRFLHDPLFKALQPQASILLDLYRMFKKIVLPTACMLLFSCGGRLSHVDKNAQLTAERTRLTQKKDPVDKTKTYIRISGLLLDLASTAAQDGDTQRLESLLGDYADTVKTARKTMVESGRDPDRMAGGYRELEISLRTQTRTLKDLQTVLSIDARDPVDKALQTITSVRQEILKYLFPSTQQATR